ncbi:hypothetical protein G0Q06_12295 [Puniceicoccales bacterium CK1056]|uniref:PKD domain-containing protein n=1 Tax=Oceanipulchritudo coccoides TaxID=2706888 RepID=A0A6B2M544_9BACT|nr:hypothetical protein [Oceanipulchritudo coccoides]NDV63237.1 hypothetical protein [Oceanipulchritudo coccoides]
MRFKSTLRAGFILRFAAAIAAIGLFASNAHAQANIIANPSFEDGCTTDTGGVNSGFDIPNGWEAFNGGGCNSDAARTGTGSAYLNNNGIGNFSAPALIQQGFAAVPGDIFYFSGWVKVDNEIDFATFKINFRDTVGATNLQPVVEDPELLPGTFIDNDASFPGIATDALQGSTVSNGGTLSDDWIFLEVRGTVPENCDLIQLIILHVPVADGGVWVDDVFGYKLDGPSYIYPKQQIVAVPNGGDIDVTWQSVAPRDYVVESTTLIDPVSTVWVDESGVVGGTGEEVTFTVLGAAPAAGQKKFFRIQSDPIDRGPIPNGLIQDPFDTGSPTMTDWLGKAVFTQGATVEEGPYNTTEAPFAVIDSNSATFGINDLKNDGDAFWDGGTAEVSVYQSFPTPENTDGVRPFVNLRGRTIIFRGGVTISEAYDSGNLGEVFIEFIGTNHEVVGYKSFDISQDNPATGDYDNGFMNATTDGKFSFFAYVPESDLNYINVGFRNTGTIDSAGEMSIIDSVVPTLQIISAATLAPWLGEAVPDNTNLVRNNLFTEGTEGLDEWELFQTWENDTITPLSDGNVTASSGVVTFGVDATDSGAASFQQNFFLPKNNAYANNTYNVYDRYVTISGNAVASGYAGGNFPEIGIQVLNLGNSINAATLFISDLTTFDDINCDGTTYDPVTGAFTISTLIPAITDGINAIQLVFRNNIVTPGGGGQLEISNVSMVVAPVADLGTATVTGTTTPAAGVDESYSVAISGSATNLDYVWEVFPDDPFDSATITGGNSSSVTINFADPGDYTLVATVCDPTATDGVSTSGIVLITVP